jgi:hypothetical protein
VEKEKAMHNSLKKQLIETMSPQAMADELEKIANPADGTLSFEDVLRSAKEQTSPLHCLFEWDNTTAANEYRKEQVELLVELIRVSLKKRRKDD